MSQLVSLTCICWILYTTRVLGFCLGSFRTSVESLYVATHEPSLGARRAKLSLQYASRIKSRSDNKYMKLFDARPNTICTFELRIKQFLTASNIDVSDIRKHLHILCCHLGISDHRRLC